MQQIYSASLNDRDKIEIYILNSSYKIKAIGCHELLGLLQTYHKNFQTDVAKWPIPNGNSHAELLLKEVLLKSRDLWQPPKTEDEICHCRSVDRDIIVNAIIGGAHSPEKISRLTSASTACGTCRTETEKLIQFYLKKY